MRRVSLRELLEAPVGRCVAGARFLYFYPSDALCGFSLWGRPDVDDMSRLVEALRVELDRERHVSLVDAGAVEAVDATAFDVLRRYVDESHDALGRVVAKLAVVLPRGGLARAAVAGFFDVARAPYPVRTFDETEGALAWLGAPATAEVAAAIAREREAALGRPPVVLELRAWLEAHIGDVTVGAAARGVGLSTRSLQRRLREASTSFQAELRAAQVAVARERLAESDAPVTRIAIELGMTPAHFSAAFKDATGLPPSEWRERHRRG